jgi:TonB family protein
MPLNDGGPPKPPGNSRQKSAKHERVATSPARIFTFALIATLALLGAFYLYQLKFGAGPAQAQPSPARASGAPQPRPPEAPTLNQTPAQSASKGNSGASAAPTVRQFQPSATPPIQHPAQAAGVEHRGPIEAPRRTEASAPAPRNPVVPAEVPAAQKSHVTNPPVAAVQPPPITPAKQEIAAIHAPIVSAPAPAPAKMQPAQLLAHVQVLTDLLRPKRDVNDRPGAPETISRTDISYPSAAIASQRQGSVILKVTVDPTGAVRGIEVLDGDSVLSGEAVRAVRQWRYKPYQAAGREVGMELLLTVNFVLSH